nr:hypothetical protein [Tanacetum cinerariifolium]
MHPYGKWEEMVVRSGYCRGGEGGDGVDVVVAWFQWIGCGWGCGGCGDDFGRWWRFWSRDEGEGRGGACYSGS